MRCEENSKPKNGEERKPHAFSPIWTRKKIPWKKGEFFNHIMNNLALLP